MSVQRPNRELMLQICHMILSTRALLIRSILTVAICGTSNLDAAYASPALQIHFDQPAPRLQARQATSAFQVLLHRMDRENYQSGKGAERISVQCPAGHSAQFALPIPAAPVISEFRADLWLFCNRPGAQLAVSVVLPRSVNPNTGKPHRLVVRSEHLGSGSQWEKLSISHLPDGLARMARVARLQSSFPIDERGAYISEILLLIPGGPGLSELLVDKLEVHGVLKASNPDQDASRTALADNASAPSQDAIPFPRVPRIIRWQGESFEFLSRLGFQVVGMARLPRPEELEEARKHGLFLICPPPSPKMITSQGISENLNSVLCWDLGDQLSEDDLGHIVRWQELIKRHDSQPERRTMLAPQRLTREASRIADIVLLDRQVLGAGLTLQDYATWMTQRTRLARPGTPTWCRIQTQLTPKQETLVRALSSNSKLSASASYSQLASMVSAATGVRSSGFYFDSRSSLEADDANTRGRVQALELTNIRLGLMEPWLAAGKLQASARSSSPQITALVLQAERSHLLIPISWSEPLDGVVAPARSGPLWFVVPGVAESSEAYLLTLGGPKRLRHERVTGGIRISLDNLPSDGLVMLSDDPSAISQVSRYLRRAAPRATQLKRALAQSHLELSSRVYSALPQDALPADTLNMTLSVAQRSLRACDEAVANRNFELAYRKADAAETSLAASDSILWKKLVARRTTAEMPLAVGFEMLPALLQWGPYLPQPNRGANRLEEAEFENLELLVDNGWRHQQLLMKHVETAVRLSPEAPHSGSYCLELEATGANPAFPPPLIPTAPVWVRSRPIKLKAGEVVEISGVARVPQQLIGSVDGLQIFDSVGGIELATRIKVAPTWQRFRMIRAATTDTELRVTISLSGLGTAQIDSLAVRPIVSRVPHQLSSTPGQEPLRAR